MLPRRLPAGSLPYSPALRPGPAVRSRHCAGRRSARRPWLVAHRVHS